MRNKLMLLRWQIAIGAILIVLSLAATSLLPGRTVAFQSDTYKEKYDALLRKGIGSEVCLPGANATSDQVNQAVNSVAAFIRRRSGLELSNEARNRLARLEVLALTDPRKRTTVDKFSKDLAKTLMKRIGSLTDAEIVQATEELRGFNASDLPDAARSARRYVKLRADRLDALTPESFIAQVRAWRGSNHDNDDDDQGVEEEEGRDRDDEDDSITGRARKALELEVRSRLTDLSLAVPSQWGATLSAGLTPLQAILIAYSIVSDDPMWHSEVQLNGLLRSLENARKRTYGYYPSAAGHFAYGTNGYIFSTPLRIVLDDRTTERLLDRMEGRRAS